MCTYACMKNTNTVDLLLAFICCNFFRSSSHWIISFVIYIRLCPYHVGTRKLSTYTLAKSSHFNSLYLSLSLSSISFVHWSLCQSGSFSFALTLFWILFHIFFLHTNNSWVKIKFWNTIILSVLSFVYFICVVLFFRCYFILRVQWIVWRRRRIRHQISFTVFMIKYPFSWVCLVLNAQFFAPSKYLRWTHKYTRVE